MQRDFLSDKAIQVYVILTSLVICGLASSIITGTKLVHIIVDFPFSNIVFAIFTYPVVDCICELWGKKIARRTMWLGLASQLLIVLLIQWSIVTPHASSWQNQIAYHTVLSSSGYVIFASVLAFSISQLLDILMYQKIKEISQGKHLWLRSIFSMCVGQAIDSAIFINIVFADSEHKFSIFLGSILVKAILSILMTPLVYLIVGVTNRYLEDNTLAFKP